MMKPESFPFELKPREPVILAQDFYALKDWYTTVLGFECVAIVDEAYRYANLIHSNGIAIGIADAAQMNCTTPNQRQNTVRLQMEVTPIAEFLAHVSKHNGVIVFGPSTDAKDGFQYGAILDIEDNEIWLVDSHCPNPNPAPQSTP